MQRHCSLRILVALSLLVAPSFVRADDEDRGRLPDGRAFRTGQDGSQLVDYIAELEVSNEALQRRIYSLEANLQKREDELTKVTKPKNESLSEKSLTVEGDHNYPSSAVPVVAGNCPSVSCPACAAVSCPQISCPAAIDTSSGIRGELERTKVELENTKIDLQLEKQSQSKAAASDGPASAKAAALERELANERAKLTSLQERYAQVSQSQENDSSALVRVNEELSKTKLALDDSNRKQELESQGKGHLTGKVSSLEEELQQIKQELADSNSARDELKAKLTSAESSATLAMARAAAADSRAAAKFASSAPAVQVASTRTSEVSAPVASATLVRSRAVESIKANFLTEINQVNALVQTRDSLFSGSQGKAGPVQFKPSAAVSSDGLNLGKISDSARSADSVREITSLRSDLTQIRRKMEDDIALMRRVGRR